MACDMIDATSNGRVIKGLTADRLFGADRARIDGGHSSASLIQLEEGQPELDQHAQGKHSPEDEPGS